MPSDSKFKKGMIPWNKGKIMPEKIRKILSENHANMSGVNNPFYGKRHSDLTKKKIGDANKGNLAWNKNLKTPDNIKEKLRVAHLGKIPWNKGIPWSEEARRKMSKSHKGKIVGKDNPNWNNGISNGRRRDRSSIEYKLWRTSVFKRDNFTCQKCGQHGGSLVAHHINNFAEVLELRLAIDNGCTLCNEHHKEFHRKCGIKHNTKEQLEEFLNN